MEATSARSRHYRSRIIDGQVSQALKTAGAVVIEGPRACGKTMTGLHHCASYVELDDPRIDLLRSVDPTALLDGEAPRLLDEWQLAPELWNLVRRRVDATPERGQFILTGSSVPADDATRHTGAGRFLRVRERTMTWFERGASTGAVSLGQLLDGDPVRTDMDSSSLTKVVDNVLTSGFPGLVPLTISQQRQLLDGYLDEIARADMRRLGDIRHQPGTLRRLLTSVGRMTGSELRHATLAADVATATPGIRNETIATYVELLERLFVVELVPAFATALRSRAKLRISPKIHLADPALAAAALSADAHALMSDPNTLGFLFESAVVHDLTVMVEARGGHIHHYRDSYDHEIDAVLTFPDGRWAAVEIKLGGGQVQAGEASLQNAVAQIDADQPPAFLAIITGTGYTTQLSNGVVTFPLSALRP